MKYINFKRFKFSTILKYINFERYNFSKIYKYFDFIRYNFFKIYKYFNFKRYNFSKIYRNFDFKTYKYFNFKIYKYFGFKIYKYFNFKIYKYFDFKIYKYLDFRRYNFSRIYKLFNFKRLRYIPIYFVSLTIFSFLIYLCIPLFYNYDKSNIANVICKDINIKCSIKGNINYTFFPSPRLKLNDIRVNDFTNKNKILGKIENIALKISVYNLLNKSKFQFTKINIKNAKFNFDLQKFEKYRNFFNKEFNSKPINLTKGEISFFEGKKYITDIKDVKIKYNSKKKEDEIVLKGKFLGDNIYINLLNKKKDEDLSKIFVFKMSDLKLFTKINIFKSDSDNDDVDGDILFKKEKNRLMAIFNFKNNQITIKQANLQNVYLDGKFGGKIVFLPYFNFDLDLDLNSINFNRVYTFLASLDKKKKENLFSIHEKINGKLNLFAD